LTKVVPVLKKDGKFIRNPQVITDKFIEDGEIVYGEFKTGEELKKAKELVKECEVDFELLDKEVNRLIWRITNLFPGCTIKTIDSMRAKKRFFWDQVKHYNRHWLAVNMMCEAYLGFNAFNTKKITGNDKIDFIKFRQLIAEGKTMGDEVYEQVFAKPQK